MNKTPRNDLVELSFDSSQTYAKPFSEVRFSARFTDPKGAEIVVPGFWGGGDTWRLRYSSTLVGEHSFETICNDEGNPGLHRRTGKIEITPYEGDNPLFEHGGLRKSASSHYLEHADGEPFYWLGDTWWMGFTSRLSWPEGFQELTRDRVDKGFSVIQMVAGLYPDMEWHDPRGANEAGFPWDKEFTTANPEYFDLVDSKIAWLVHCGLVPCIVGCWGYFLDSAGLDVIKRHWDYLVARYAAYPVVWCLAGEAVMPFYLNREAKDEPGKTEYATRLRSGWTEVARRVKGQDPFSRPVTIHPTRFGHEMVDEPELLDLNMLQTGHGSFFSLPGTVDMIESAVNAKPRLPVINSEACYEGICGSSGADVQRFLFWSCALSGTCGHTYGANGIWQLNSAKALYGPSPHGATWGNTTWEEAMHLPGSKQVGLGAGLLRRFRWWEFEPHPEWVEEHSSSENRFGPYAAGIPGEVRVIFMPFLDNFGWGEIDVLELEPDVTYHAFYFDPVGGDEYDQGIVKTSEGRWRSGKFPIFQDWVLVLESRG